MGRPLLVIIVLGVGIGVATMYRKPAEEQTPPTVQRTIIGRTSHHGNSINPNVAIGSQEPITNLQANIAETAPFVEPAISANVTASPAKRTRPAVPALTERLAPIEPEVNDQEIDGAGGYEPPTVQYEESPRRAYAPPVEHAPAPAAKTPPNMPSTFQQTLTPVPPPLPELSTSTNRQPIEPAPVARVQQSDRFHHEEEHEESERMHVVRNGDTLEKLAQRYLGSESRANEIYELNREQLSSPELLPIGVVLKLPSRRQAVQPRPQENRPAAQPERPDRRVEPSYLLPLQPIPPA